MMQSPENSKAAFWSCPTTQIFSLTSPITHTHPATQRSGISSSPQTSFFYHTQPIYYRFRCNKPCSFSKCDQNRRCSLLPFPGFLPVGHLSLPPCPGVLCSCHPPLQEAQACHFRHAKTATFSLQIPISCKAGGLGNNPPSLLWLAVPAYAPQLEDLQRARQCR